MGSEAIFNIFHSAVSLLVFLHLSSYKDFWNHFTSQFIWWTPPDIFCNKSLWNSQDGSIWKPYYMHLTTHIYIYTYRQNISISCYYLVFVSPAYEIPCFWGDFVQYNRSIDSFRPELPRSQWRENGRLLLYAVQGTNKHCFTGNLPNKNYIA